MLTNNPANKTTIDRSTIARNAAGANSLGSGVSVDDAESVKVSDSIISGNTGDGTQQLRHEAHDARRKHRDRRDSAASRRERDKINTDPLIAAALTRPASAETPVLTIPSNSPALEFAGACTRPISATSRGRRARLAIRAHMSSTCRQTRR